ncbi:hypothetical protein CNEONATNEC26_02002 [Clostridium neonatale]|nr:hypothetical protein CNEONATNEC26_02002 [Clostridium neonatale]
MLSISLLKSMFSPTSKIELTVFGMLISSTFILNSLISVTYNELFNIFSSTDIISYRLSFINSGVFLETIISTHSSTILFPPAIKNKPFSKKFN